MPCFLQVRLVDAGEAAGEHGLDVHVAGLQRRLFARRPFAVVFVGDDDRAFAARLVAHRHLEDRVVGAGRLAPDVVGVVRLKGIDGHRQRRLRHLRNVAHILDAARADVVRRALALYLHEERERREVLAVPGRPLVDVGEAVLVFAEHDFLGLERGLPAARFRRGIALQREFRAAGRAEAECLTVRRSDRVGFRIERKRPRERIDDRHVGRNEERLGKRIAVVAVLEVAVEGGDDRVAPLRVVLARPHADARPAGWWVSFWKKPSNGVGGGAAEKNPRSVRGGSAASDEPNLRAQACLGMSSYGQ